jgi:hypothetical protein
VTAVQLSISSEKTGRLSSTTQCRDDGLAPLSRFLFKASSAQAGKRSRSTTSPGSTRIERTIVVASEGSPDVIKEIHVLTFPDAEALAGYRNDRRLAELAHLRDESVIHTELLAGVEGPIYST